MTTTRLFLSALLAATAACGGAKKENPPPPCSPQALGKTNVGCEFWPTITGNPVSASYSFAVAVSNSAAVDADVEIDGGGLVTPETFTVPAGGVTVRTLPWVAALKLCVAASSNDCLSSHPNSALVAGGAFHLTSTSPVAVYQFNPLDFTLVGVAELSYTNDASLLFPAHAWGLEYRVATWNQTASILPSLLAVTALQDNTTVTLTSPVSTAAEGGAPAFAAGMPQALTLNAGDVLEVGTVTGDLTGSRVVSDKPVQVLGAHYCANVPEGFGYCDHLEESMPPISALGKRYLLNAPALPSLPAGKEETVRIVATAAGTTLAYDPAVAGAPTSLSNAGDYADIPRIATSFQVTSNQKILVVQLMEGSTVGGGMGDPAMAVAVPVEQFRSSYRFVAPPNYTVNYVDITAPASGTVTLDGAPVTSFTAIGTSTYRVARLELDLGPGGDGVHFATGSAPFGIQVYGYGTETSYWYPGGMGLGTLP